MLFLYPTVSQKIQGTWAPQTAWGSPGKLTCDSFPVDSASKDPTSHVFKKHSGRFWWCMWSVTAFEKHQYKRDWAFFHLVLKACSKSQLPSPSTTFLRITILAHDSLSFLQNLPLWKYISLSLSLFYNFVSAVINWRPFTSYLIYLILSCHMCKMGTKIPNSGGYFEGLMQ